MNIPFYKRTHRSLPIAVFLLVVYGLLLITGLGIFRLYFSFDWTADSDPHQLFNLRINAGQSLNVFDAAPFGKIFWLAHASLLLLTLCMPFFRLAGALILAGVTAAVLLSLHVRLPATSAGTPMEFELLILLVLLAIYALLVYVSSLRDHKKVSRLLSRFVPQDIRDQYQQNPELLSVDGEEREVSVLFCDIRDFSSSASQLEPGQLAGWLNDYFSHVSKIVVRHRGSVDKYMGDCVMAVWGAPLASQTHAYDALLAALDIQKELSSLNTALEARQLPAIQVGIGISTGTALVGPLGSEHRMDYTVIGETVNVAQSLERQTRKYPVPVIVGDTTTEGHPDLLFRELDTVRVKGKQEPVTIYQPLCTVAEANNELLDNIITHEKAMSAAALGDWGIAADLFNQLRNCWGPATMYDVYLAGIEQASVQSAGRS